ncbi:methyl-accepting chemotaxis protein [Vibrio nitrifigilis]|uniref:Methyl-accepting chemotaxis protein n=1 Tax=Vibrio nitrifigilis TaxID=2789781 RepID=A0ABS0GCL1_9VIBR|nr:methyl-accepting chemotaxis protein [Vibrio nitrifigilis]MBF9000148.1 methyl-accepting chemotaxis protein [Vibrio nitrifigilis]
MNWRQLSIRSRMFVVTGLLLIIFSSIFTVKQTTTTISHELDQLRDETLPTYLHDLSAQISAEINPYITASEMMANSPFIERWVDEKLSADDEQTVQKTLRSIKEKVGSDNTFLALDGSNGTQYIQYADEYTRIPLAKYPFKDFYSNFLATNKEYELNMEHFKTGFVLFINYRSQKINPNTNKPYVVAGLGLKVDRLINMVTKLKIGEHGRGMIVTENGEIQAKPDEQILSAFNSNNIQSLLGNKNAVNIITKEIDGKSYYLGSLWVPTLGRYLVVEVPYQQITGPVYQQLLSIILFVVVFVILSLIALHFAVGSLTKPLQSILEEVHQTAEDLDLNRTIQTKDKAEIGRLADAINSLLNTLKSSIQTVNHAVNATDSSVTLLNQQSRELFQAAAAEEQSVKHIFTATQDITQQSLQMTQLADQAGNLSEQGKHDLQRADSEIQHSLVYLRDLGSEMQSSKQRLDELNGHIEQILSVLSVITSISDQTNLLALNAAIEAARAGEHGRGFAVVADEVRMLSQRTHDSTGEIQTIISQLRSSAKEVTHCIVTACETSETTLESQNTVVTTVEQLNQFMGQLFSLNQQVSQQAELQNVAVSEINQQLEELGAQSDQTSRLFDLSKQATHSISTEMENLKQQVTLFKGV